MGNSNSNQLMQVAEKPFDIVNNLSSGNISGATNDVLTTPSNLLQGVNGLTGGALSPVVDPITNVLDTGTNAIQQNVTGQIQSNLIDPLRSQLDGNNALLGGFGNQLTGGLSGLGTQLTGLQGNFTGLTSQLTTLQSGLGTQLTGLQNNFNGLSTGLNSTLNRSVIFLFNI